MVYLLSFFLFICYNYYGDNMNNSDIVVTIRNMKDIDNITNNTKYINLSIDSISCDVIDYFLLYGKDYSYSDTINGKNGFIYASFDMFKDSEYIINSIIDNMPNNLNEIEKIRYIYISLGKILCSDINIMDDKNEMVSFNKISTINNIWGALSKRKVVDASVSKIFMYICFRLGIKCELVSASIKGNIANKVYINNSFLIVDLFNDLHYIQSGSATRYFDKYNDDKVIDKKILYIKDEYTDICIDRALKNIDYTNENVVEEILNITSGILNINNIGTYELYKIYRSIFDKYAPNYDVRINNLFISNSLDMKEHFALFSYNDNYYSYNYSRGTFISMDYNVLYDNIKNNRIGIYDDEDFELREKRVVL